jgi:hypothetical protein
MLNSQPTVSQPASFRGKHKLRTMPNTQFPTNVSRRPFLQPHKTNGIGAHLYTANETHPSSQPSDLGKCRNGLRPRLPVVRSASGPSSYAIGEVRRLGTRAFPIQALLARRRPSNS